MSNATGIFTVQIVLSSKGAEQTLRSLGDAAEKFDGKATRASHSTNLLERMLGGLLRPLAALGAGYSFARLAQDIVATGSAYEQLEARLKTVTGSQEKAAGAFAAIKQLARDLPFEVQGITAAVVQLAAAGIQPTESLIKSLSNTAAAFGKDITEMSNAVRAAVVGEFDPLKQFGVQMRAEGDQVKASFHGVTTEIGRDAQSIVAYLKQLGDVEYATASADQMDTLAGKWSNLKDAIAQLFAEIYNSGTSDVLGQIVTDLAAGAEQMRLMVVEIRTGSSEFGIMARDIGTAAGAIGGLIAAHIVTTLKNVVTVLTFLIGHWDVWAAGAAQATGTVSQVLAKVVAGVYDVAAGIVSAFDVVPDPILKFLGLKAGGAELRDAADRLHAQAEAWRRLGAEVKGTYDQIADERLERWVRLTGEGKAKAEGAATGVDRLAASFGKLGKNAASATADQDKLDKMLERIRIKGLKPIEINLKVDLYGLEKINDRLKEANQYREEGLPAAAKHELYVRQTVARMRELKMTEEEIARWLKENGRLAAEFSDAIVPGSWQDSWRNAMAGFNSLWRSAVQEFIVTGDVSWNRLRDGFKQIVADMATDFIARWVKTLVQWLQAWIAKLIAAKAAERAANLGGSGSASVPAAGGGGGGMPAGGAAGGASAGGGSGGGAAGGMAAMGATIAAFALIYFVAKDWIDKHKHEVEQFRIGGTPGGEALTWSLTGNSSIKHLGAVADQMIKTVTEVIRGLGGYIQGWSGATDLTVNREGHGKKTDYWVQYANGLVEHFGNNAEAAFQFAMVQAIKQTHIGGLPAEVQDAIADSAARTVEQLQKEIEAAMQLVATRLGDVGFRVYEIFRKYALSVDDEMKRRLDALSSALGGNGPGGLGGGEGGAGGGTSGSPDGVGRGPGGRGLSKAAVDAMAEEVKAVHDLIAARNREVDAIGNSLLGVDSSASKRLADIASFNRGIEEANNLAAAQIATVQRELDALGDASSESADHLRQALQGYLDELNKIPEAISGDKLNLAIFDTLFRYLQGSGKYAEQAHKYALLKVEIEFAAIKAQLVALGKWEEFAQMFNDAYAAAQRDAGRKPGGGGGKKEGVRDFIADRRFALGNEDLPEWKRQINEINREYAEHLKDTGKDQKLRAELLALQAQETGLIKEKARQAVLAKVEDYVTGGGSEFDRIRRTAHDLVKEIEDSPLGDPRKQAEIGRVLKAMDQQLEQLGRRAVGDLLGQVAGLLEMVGENGQAEELLRQQKILNFTLTLAEAKARMAQLIAEGFLIGKNKDLVEAALRFLDGIDPNTAFGPGSGGGGGPNYDDGSWQWTGAGWVHGAPAANDNSSSNIDRARGILDDWLHRGAPAIVTTLANLRKDFEFVRTTLGDTAEVNQAYARAVQEAIDEWLQPLRDAQQELIYGPQTINDPMQQWSAIQAEFAQAQAALAAGDLSAIENAPDLVQRLLQIAQQVLPTGSQGYAQWFNMANQFLQQAIAAGQNVGAAALGSTSNPMAVAGVPELAAIGQEQLNVLWRAEQFQRRSAETLDSIDQRLSVAGGVGGGVA